MNKHRINIKIPKYTLGEELFNSISHGIGAAFSVVALVLLILKAQGALSITAVTLYASSMIFLYTISCVYHALSKNLEGKKVLRVIDHCNVFLLVYGTYIPVSLLGVGGIVGVIVFFSITLISAIGITLTAIKVDKMVVLEVLCHLISGWGILFFSNYLLKNMGTNGYIYLVLGGAMYTLGSILYAIGHKLKYMHSVFHIFCLLGSMFHFMCIYFSLL